MWVAWNSQDTDLPDPLGFEDKVELFYQQILGWHLHIADLMLNGGEAFPVPGEGIPRTVQTIPHAAFAALQVCLSYFETIGVHLGATGTKLALFRAGAIDVWPELREAEDGVGEAVIQELYKEVRCGLYHNVLTTSLVFPDRARFPGVGALCFGRSEHGQAIVGIYPERLPRELEAHLSRYRDQLLDPAQGERRAAFEAAFDNPPR